ncbi:MAG: 3-oxoacyl-ACP synthase III family protein [Thermaurantimonas sp.]|uniref:3-oxoacyl-ACP synthase III family protein n=1 Tax=Thermaurantimonas sp. TaxID=2681568 RepID=UPI00391D61C7
MRRAILAGTGIGLANRILPNSYFNETLGEDVDTWLRQNVEIYERRWCDPNQSTVSLCLDAAKMALNNADIGPEDLNLIIIATDTPEYISPSTASVVQYKLGAVNAATFDVNTACAGFVSALDTAAKYIAADPQYRYVLVIGAYAMSRYLNPIDKKTVTLFADGAGAAVLKAEEHSDRGYLHGIQITQGQYYDWMGIYAGGTAQPVTPEVVEQGDHYLKFVRKFPKELNPQMWTMMTHKVLNHIGRTPEDVRMFFMTQININSLRETMDNLSLPHDRAITIMHHYGYTGSAAIPTALHHAVTEGKVKTGDLIMLIGSGGGLAFAASAMIL